MLIQGFSRHILRSMLIGFAVVMASAGIAYAAVNTYVGMQVESGTKTANACTMSDTTASGGQVVRFAASACGGANPLSNLPAIAWHGGPAYWAQFPDAVKAGWDQPTFFPVGVFWDFWPAGNNAQARAAIQWDKDHGINFYTHGNNDQDACALRDVGGMSWLGAPGTLQNLNTCGENVWPGNYLEDELDGTSGSNSAAFAELTLQSTAARRATPNKFVGVNYTSIPVQIWTPDVDGGRYINDNFADMISIDDYVFSTPNKCNAGNPNWWPFIGPAPLSQAQCRQGQSYGRLTESIIMRDALDAPRKPLSAFIDIYGGADPAVATHSPAEVKAAAMSNVIHGAGFIIWFPLSFYPSCSTNRLMDASVPTCAAANTTAAGEINNQIKSWAPILNTQSYQHAFGANLDTNLKWYDGAAYIFAMTSGGTGSRTFTLPSGLASAASVTETTSGQTITVNGGAFTDTFTNSTDYRVYRVTP